MPIIFNPQGLVEQVMRNPATALNKEICAAQLIKVWEAVASFIVDQLCKGKGVKIPGLATITYKVKAVDMSQQEVIVQKVPHILLSAKLAKRHGLQVKRPVYTLDLPEVDLNFSWIAMNTQLTRAHVGYCMDEIVCAFNRALACDPQVEFWFPKIGRVVIQCGKVDVVFSSEFLDRLGLSDEYIQDKACPLR